MFLRKSKRILALLLSIILIICTSACGDATTDVLSSEPSSSDNSISSTPSSNNSSAPTSTTSSSTTSSSTSSGNPNPDLPNPPSAKEYLALDKEISLPIEINHNLRYNDGAVGETITPVEDSSWSCASFSVSNNNTYTVSFYSAHKADVPYIYLCDEKDIIKEIFTATSASAKNDITFTVDDKSVSKVYVRSLNNSTGSIKVMQTVDVNSNVDMNLLKQLKVNIVTPYKYSAWPMLGVAKGRLVCLYTVADQHSSTESSLYMKTSSTNGITWTEGKEIFTDKTGVKGITGTGTDSKGNMLIWYRNGKPGAWQTTHELYKTNGDVVVQVSVPNFALRGGHIGNIFSVEGKGLFAFYNTYGDTRSWGILKSADDGVTWEQIPIETNVSKAECPVEIDGVYLGDGKILALGRKDSSEGTIAMFQIESSDFGNTWTKEYTNITDSLGSSPSLIFDSKTGQLSLYFFARTSGQLKRREVNVKDVWGSPLNWSESKILVSESARGQDTGNVKTVSIDGLHIATYYAGNATTTGVYGVIIKD